MVSVTGSIALPSMGLHLSARFRNSDPRPEEAAAARGAGRWQIPTRITVPLMLPGILVVLAYFTIIFIGVFEVPLAIRTSAEIPVLVVADSLSGMNSSDFDLVNSLPASAGWYGGTALQRVAGNDGWSAAIPLVIAPKTLQHKILPRGIMRKIGGLNRHRRRIDRYSSAGHGDDYVEDFPSTQ